MRTYIYIYRERERGGLTLTLNPLLSGRLLRVPHRLRLLHIYIYIEREREREREIHTYIHTYIHIYYATPHFQGAFYVFPTVSAFYNRTAPSGVSPADSASLCHYLLAEEHLALVPGDAFGAAGCLRISYATSMEILAASMDRMERGLARLK